jgi:hypothetical protein
VCCHPSYASRRILLFNEILRKRKIEKKKRKNKTEKYEICYVWQFLVMGLRNSELNVSYNR